MDLIDSKYVGLISSTPTKIQEGQTRPIQLPLSYLWRLAEEQEQVSWVYVCYEE